MAKNISTKRGKGRVRVPPSQLTAEQRGRATRLGEIFYMDKPSKGPQEGPRDVHGYSGVKKPTRRFTLKRTYGKPKAGTGTVEVSFPKEVKQKKEQRRKAAEQMGDVEFAIGKANQFGYTKSDRKKMDAIHERLKKEREQKREQRRKAAEQADASQMEASKFKKIRKNPDFQPFKEGGKVVYKATGGGMKFQLYGGSSKNIHDGNKEVAQFYDQGEK